MEAWEIDFMSPITARSCFDAVEAMWGLGGGFFGAMRFLHDLHQKRRCAQAGFRSCQRDDGWDQFHDFISPDFGLSYLLSSSCVSPSLRK
jgi:hypothetical protein